MYCLFYSVLIGFCVLFWSVFCSVLFPYCSIMFYSLLNYSVLSSCFVLFYSVLFWCYLLPCLSCAMLSGSDVRFSYGLPRSCSSPDGIITGTCNCCTQVTHLHIHPYISNLMICNTETILLSHIFSNPFNHEISSMITSVKKMPTKISRQDRIKRIGFELL